MSENRKINQWWSVRLQTDHSSFCLLTRLNTEEDTIILCVDYYFVIKWSEFAEIENKSCLNTKTHLKNLFSKYGFPDTVISDNCPQCSTTTLTNFSIRYGFVQKNSSPHFEQSNLEAKRTVQTLINLIKNLIKKATDPYRAMLAYRNSADKAEPLLRTSRVSKEISMRLKARKWQQKINIDKHEQIIDSSQTKRKCI